MYPLGSQVILKNVLTNQQTFLEGHSCDVNCLAVSKDGSLMASGQRNPAVTAAHVLVWDLNTAKKNCDNGSRDDALIHRLQQHLGAVQDVDFSFDSHFLATLGGQVGRKKSNRIGHTSSQEKNVDRVEIKDNLVNIPGFTHFLN